MVCGGLLAQGLPSPRLLLRTRPAKTITDPSTCGSPAPTAAGSGPPDPSPQLTWEVRRKDPPSQRPECPLSKVTWKTPAPTWGGAWGPEGYLAPRLKFFHHQIPPQSL